MFLMLFVVYEKEVQVSLFCFSAKIIFTEENKRDAYIPG